MILGQLMLALSGFGLQKWDLVLGAVRAEAAGEGSGHVAQGAVAEIGVRTVQMPPPSAHSSAGDSQGEIGIEDDAVQALIGAIK
jgi:hypothetical protein